MTQVDIGYRRLAAAVLRLCARDIYKEQHKRYRVAERAVLSGNCDLYFELVYLPVSKQEFINCARRTKVS